MKYNGRRKNARRNAISGIFNMVILMILPFLSRTIILRELGTSYLGLGSLFSAIFQVLNMAEMGFSSAVTFNLYKPLAEKNDDLVCAYLAYYRKAYKIIGVIVLIIGGVIVPFLPHLIKGSYPEEINIYVLYAIYLINASSSYFFFSYKGVLLSATQRRDILNNINSIFSIIKNLLQVFVLIFFKNYYMFVVCVLVTTIINNLIIGVAAKKMYPQYISVGRLTSSELKSMQRVVKGAAISKISSASRNSFDSIILSMFCGLTDVAIYSNYYYIMTALLGIIQVFTEAMAAGIGDSIAKESSQKNYSDFKKFSFFFSFVGAWFSICLFFMYQPFMELWTGKKEMVATPLTMFLFVIYFYIEQIGAFRSIYTRACGLWWDIKVVAIMESVCNLLLNFILGFYFGMNGILVATITTVFIFSIMATGKATINKCFQCSAVEYGVSCIKYFAITILCGFITYIGIAIFKCNRIIDISIVCAIVPPLLLGCVGFISKKTRVYILGVREIIK